MQWSNVDLPEPDGPMMAVNRPVGNSTVTSSIARTAVSPAPYTLVACSARATAGAGAHVEAATERDRSLPHARDAAPAPRVGARCAAQAVVVDLHGDVVIAICDSDCGGRPFPRGGG